MIRRSLLKNIKKEEKEEEEIVDLYCKKPH